MNQINTQIHGFTLFWTIEWCLVFLFAEAFQGSLEMAKNCGVGTKSIDVGKRGWSLIAHVRTYDF